ncbi:MAG: hypothetical protein LBP40_04310 [Campylobacteraceae bacterium]|jgi:Cu(I)/Ag(I) efflux system membrane fusion protein|nr:hypothetical protein [Campylobacteraceae bacterium]
MKILKTAVLILFSNVLVFLATWYYFYTPPETQKERQVLFWYDPMYPNTRFDAPGQSPFIDMDLVPKYADEEQINSVRIDSVQTQNLGLRTAKAYN